MDNLITWRAQINGQARAARRPRNPCPLVSAADRALIEAAVSAGRVSIHPTAFVAPTRQAEMSR